MNTPELPADVKRALDALVKVGNSYGTNLEPALQLLHLPARELISQWQQKTKGGYRAGKGEQLYLFFLCLEMLGRGWVPVALNDGEETISLPIWGLEAILDTYMLGPNQARPVEMALALLMALLMADMAAATEENWIRWANLMSMLENSANLREQHPNCPLANAVELSEGKRHAERRRNLTGPLCVTLLVWGNDPDGEELVADSSVNDDGGWNEKLQHSEEAALAAVRASRSNRAALLFAQQRPIGLPPTQLEQETDALAVKLFSEAMLTKLAEARNKGRGGWHTKDASLGRTLARMLVDHLRSTNEGNWIDLANFCMFLHLRGESESLLKDELELRITKVVGGFLK